MRRSEIQERRTPFVALPYERYDFAVDERDVVRVEFHLIHGFRDGIVGVSGFSIGCDVRSGAQSAPDFGYSARERGERPFSGHEVEERRRALRAYPKDAIFSERDRRLHSESHGIRNRFVSVRIPCVQLEFGDGIGIVIQSSVLSVVLAPFLFGAFFGKDRPLRPKFRDGLLFIGSEWECDDLPFEFDDTVDLVVGPYGHVLRIGLEAVGFYDELVFERRDFVDGAIARTFCRQYVRAGLEERYGRAFRSFYGHVDFGDVPNEIVIRSEADGGNACHQYQEGYDSVAHSRWKKKIPHSVGIGILVPNYTEYAPVCK